MNKFQIKSEYKFALILECILYVNTGWQQVSKGISIRQRTQDFYFFFPFRGPDSYPLLKITNVIYLVLLLELWEFGDVGPFCGPTQGQQQIWMEHSHTDLWKSETSREIKKSF